VNVQGTRNVLAAALENNAAKVIYTSTMDIFAKDKDGFLVENNVDPHPKHSAYERSKQDAEVVCDEFMNKHGLPVIFMNCSAVYGPSPVLTGLNEMLPLLIHGEIPTLLSGGMPVVYIDGVAKAHVDAVEFGSPGERYLLADRHMSMKDIAQAIAQAYAELYPEAPPVKIPSVMPAWLVKFLGSTTTFATRHLHIGQKPLVPRTIVDLLLWDPLPNTTKAEQSLGFKPHDISEGFRKALSSVVENGFLRPIPEKDCDVGSCKICDKRFCVTTRRHHCRKCGQIICRNCSRQRAKLSDLGYSKPVRVCKTCESESVV